MMPAIRVEYLGKAYRRYGKKYGRLAEWLGFGCHHQLKWVLRDVSFQVARGQAVGILGANGAGKSTLLKIISGTTQATTGTVSLAGRVAALLELGMGFHPDFTGRQNVLMAGALRGVDPGQLQQSMAEIESFAAIGDYLDEPVRTYSSGMQMRVAFAAATAIRPDILIVDEALAVGDAAFARKCFRRIESFLEAGTSVLFVSHDTDTVKRICDTALFLANGEVREIGDAARVCTAYERHLFGAAPATIVSLPAISEAASTTGIESPSSAPDKAIEYGNGQATIIDYWLDDDQGEPVSVAHSGDRIFWNYRFVARQSVECVTVAMAMRTIEGVRVFSCQKLLENPIQAGSVVTVRFCIILNVTPADYFMNAGIYDDSDGHRVTLHRRVDCMQLRVTGNDDEFQGVSGIAHLFPEISIVASPPHQ
jgi:lipopolysaccharide transport system ATP-binding protein